MKRAYFDAAYIAKCYLREPDARAVREVAQSCDAVHTSAFSIAEIALVFHRHLREGTLNVKSSPKVREQFWQDVTAQIWIMEPVTNHLLQKLEIYTRRLPADVFLRAGDAIHLVSALDAGFTEIWSNDRHLLAAAAHFGLRGRSVGDLIK